MEANDSTTKVDPQDMLLVQHDAAELVFGLVGPTGVDLSKVCESLSAQLRTVNYKTEIITLSELILPFLNGNPEFDNEYERISRLMTEGTELRRQTQQADVVARLGLAKIRAVRERLVGKPHTAPDEGVAYIVRSFKRPEEVQLYRNVYGKAFTLISVYAPRDARRRNLARKLHGVTSQDRATPEELAVRLITKDYIEDGKLGQAVSETFPLADYFVTSESRSQLDRQMRRLVRLTFGDPYLSPSRDEQGMFFASSCCTFAGSLQASWCGSNLRRG